MVMRNRHDGAGASRWWDDPPPGVKARFDPHPAADHDTREYLRPALDPVEPPPCLPATHWLRELGRLALVFVAVAVANVFVLLVALSFLAGGPLAPVR